MNNLSESENVRAISMLELLLSGERMKGEENKGWYLSNEIAYDETDKEALKKLLSQLTQ